MSIAISTAIAAKSANTGLSSTKAPMIDNCANSRSLKASQLANTDFDWSAEAATEPPLSPDTGAELPVPRGPVSPRTAADGERVEQSKEARVLDGLRRVAMFYESQFGILFHAQSPGRNNGIHFLDDFIM
jgi:hypothetical protein